MDYEEFEKHQQRALDAAEAVIAKKFPGVELLASQKLELAKNLFGKNDALTFDEYEKRKESDRWYTPSYFADDFTTGVLWESKTQLFLHHREIEPELVRPVPSVEDVVDQKISAFEAEKERPATAGERINIFRANQDMSPEDRLAAVPFKKTDVSIKDEKQPPPDRYTGPKKLSQHEIDARIVEDHGPTYTMPAGKLNRLREAYQTAETNKPQHQMARHAQRELDSINPDKADEQLSAVERITRFRAQQEIQKAS
jgi:hypothetical protein